MNTRHASMLVVAIAFGPTAVAEAPDPVPRADVESPRTALTLNASAPPDAQLRAASPDDVRKAVTPALAVSPATATKDRGDPMPCPATTFVASLRSQPPVAHIDADHVNALRRVSATGGPTVEPPPQTEPGNLGLLLAAFGLAATILYRRLHMLVPKDL